jgi:hypothetical protein
MAKAKKMTKKFKRELALAVFNRAKQLLSKRKGWAKEWFAYDKNGKEVEIADKVACSFCATGAVYRAIHDFTGETEPFDFVFDYLGFDRQDIEKFNDEAKSKKPVLELFNAAIQKLEAQA